MLLPLLPAWFSACASPSPVKDASPPPVFARIEEVVPRWLPFARETAPGLDYCSGSVRNPQLRFRAIRVDLAEPALRIVVNGDPALEDGPVGNGHIPSVRVSGFVRRYGCLAGINTAPFRPSSAREGEPRTIVGLAVSRGVLIAPPDPRYDALVFYKNPGPKPRAAILNQGEIGSLDEIEHAAAGFFIVLKEGLIPERFTAAANPPREPRSAAGLSAGGAVLYLLVIDGRQSLSAGATQAETGLLLKALGAMEGISFDGGGSSALALRFPGGEVRPVNRPVHGGIPGRERAVAACLGIAPADTPAGE